MAIDPLQEILSRAKHLPLDDQLRLLGELKRTLDDRQSNGHASVRELKGLGKEIWSGLDAQEYVRRERTAWNG